MRFIPSSVPDEEAPGADAEQEVFNRLKRAFRGSDDGIGFYRFPVVDRSGERFDREPDFLILHKEYGLVVVEVKGYDIKNIDRIVGQNWYLQGTQQSKAQPYSQARDQAFFVRSYFQREQRLCDDRGRCLIPATALVALSNITRSEWKDAGFESNPSQRVLLADDLTPSSLQQQFDNLPVNDSLSEETYRDARAILTGGEVLSKTRGSVSDVPETKKQYYEHIEYGLKRLDEEQEELGVATPDGPQQIRGIAGSGKTVLLAMKAAALHIKNPEWRIALTFHTRSLYETIETLADRFVAHYGDTERTATFEILHGWGGRGKHGLYYKLAQEADINPKNVDEAQDAFGNDLSPSELLGAIAEEVAKQGEIDGTYDAIFIDEGQDFEPGFYQMCYEALTDAKRLVWGYDEAQNLTNLTAPTPRRIFGADSTDDLPEKLDLRGQYSGNIPKSRVMRRSYRAPREVLMIAHSVGMALKNPDLQIPRITRQDGWEDIGYEVTGDFRAIGETIELQRPAEFSPHPLEKYPNAQPFVSYEEYNSKEEEIESVADQVAEDIHSEQLPPDEIMIIPLGTPRRAKNLEKNIAEALAEQDVSTIIASEGNKDVFSKPEHVTISRVTPAKGNEAAAVYILNLDAAERDTWETNPVRNRNELFVALTRTRAWCTITGTGTTDSVAAELKQTIDEVTESDHSITFPAPPQRDADIDLADLPGQQSNIDEFE